MKKVGLSSAMLLWVLLVSNIASAASLQHGMQGEAVRALQEALVQAGYLARAVDGEYGSTTVKAVAEFQKDKKIRVTGIADDETRKAIERAIDKGYRNGGGIVYAEGNRGDEIIAMQKKLIRLGYLEGELDGVYGSDTVRAVKKLQKEQGIPLSGAVDEATWKVLEEKQKPRGRKKAQSSLYAPGDRGHDIESLQKKLKKIEYLTGDVDGIYGADTKRSVFDFQKEEGMPATGEMDEETLARLERRYDEAKKEWVIGPGSRGKRVIRLQNQLFLHGYYPGSSDGIYGAGTESAVKKLQEEEKLKRTGRADAAVWDVLDMPPLFRGAYKKAFSMKSTAYTPYDGGGEGRTALGNYAGKGHAAVDPSVIPLGSIVFIEGYGYAICDDIGGAIQGHIIDVGVDTLSEAYAWGTREDVKVYLVK